MAKIDQGIQ